MWLRKAVLISGFREIICGAGKSVPIGCSGDKEIAIKRLYGCENCRGDQCSESILDKENIDHVWSRCNLSSSCNIVPTKINEGQGLGVEYQCTGKCQLQILPGPAWADPGVVQGVHTPHSGGKCHFCRRVPFSKKTVCLSPCC
jgi:hypothetical protein